MDLKTKDNSLIHLFHNLRMITSINKNNLKLMKLSLNLERLSYQIQKREKNEIIEMLKGIHALNCCVYI